jgi:hypothetical protein
MYVLVLFAGASRELAENIKSNLIKMFHVLAGMYRVIEKDGRDLKQL